MGAAQILSRSMTIRDGSSEHWKEAEFRAVFFQHYARMVAVLLRLLGDASQAEEVANDIWARSSSVSLTALR